MEIRGKTVVILLEDLYNEFEFWYPYYRMKEAGATVVVAGTGRESYTSKHGLVAKADRAVDQIDPAGVDAVIIPGGYAPDLMRRSPALVDFVRRMDQQGKVVAAICHAGWVLASAGILKGRRATGFSSIRDDMVNAGAEYLDQEVVRDGNLITSRQPADLPAFCRTIIEALR
ncbi:type 1 glutamine amidotransferase domain-containing protein [Caldinitratiruptor microaerophilus]|uniref:Protease n=1 Tax=Caldinitratiruptor microaerophilus TaxID=671077 RepID=A0AA35CRD7_9FIRM|nr:type 1 glutamine amidotransferase domain-containing protein [Caldinitratiruptor microaerophilus]BDG62410.1 protease [Caldinitratiruptor microaerophilus]